MSWRVFGEAFVTLLVILDPIGNAPLFVTLTREMAPRRRQLAAIQAVLVAGALILGFALAGHIVLTYLRVTTESMAVAGGILLFLVSLEMLGHPSPRMVDSSNVALVPLATPLLAGPGAIAASMVLVRENATASGRIAVVAGIVLALVMVGVVLLLADRLARVMPPAVINFLTRVFGLLLTAIAVQLVVDGLLGLAQR